jgi:predicted RNase H-like HicB family nuclease
MKKLKLEELPAEAHELADAAQREHLLLTRNGDPCAVVMGVINKDGEDFEYMTSPEFWQMIEERRREPTIPFEQLKMELAAKEALLRRFTMVIHWSDEHQAFVATLPEFGYKAAGRSYEEAAHNGQDALASLIETYEAKGRSLPESTKPDSPIGVA